jgi:hypothetical protein
MFAVARVTPAPAVPATRVPEVLPIMVRAVQPTPAPEAAATLGPAAVPTAAPAVQTTRGRAGGSIRGRAGGSIVALAARHMMVPGGQLTQVPVARVTRVLVGPATQGPGGRQIAPECATEAQLAGQGAALIGHGCAFGAPPPFHRGDRFVKALGEARMHRHGEEGFVCPSSRCAGRDDGGAAAKNEIFRRCRT